MERVTSKEECHAALAFACGGGRSVGLVPTMGALHDGHLSLVRAARELTDTVVVSVFVNPTQFGPGEDFAAYPRDLDRDRDVLEAESVDIVFAPEADGMYAPDAQVTVDPGPLGDVLEGASRPGHMRGVATVVTKLLTIVRPDAAFFGEKDYQQLRVVQVLVRDLDLGVEVIACPTVREPDGLALSSRNAYLSSAERGAATALSRALGLAAEAAATGERDAGALLRLMEAELTAETLVDTDYVTVADPVTLEPIGWLEGPARALVAARVGRTRLIDNMALAPPHTAEGGVS